MARPRSVDRADTDLDGDGGVPPAAATKVDRRVRRSIAALQKALIELALEKGYQATTIEDITNRADVARATFYAHYSDKQALLTSIAIDLTEDMTRQFAPLAPVSATWNGAVSLAMFKHAAANRDVYRFVFSGAGDPPAFQAFVDSLAESTRRVFVSRLQRTRGEQTRVQPRQPVEFLARMWIGEQVALLSWWLHDDPPYTAEQMALMRTRYQIYGAEWAHGMEPGEWVFDESLFGPADDVHTTRAGALSKRGTPATRRSAAKP
ncbi:MAG: TetR/AcrR family transcriptional regulator [Acidothermaceae bacterium]